MNYETQCTALRLDSDEHTCSMVREWAQEAAQELRSYASPLTQAETARFRLADRLREYFYARLANAKWSLLADHYLSEESVVEPETEC